MTPFESSFGHRQPDALSLFVEQRSTDAVNADAVVVQRNGRQERHNLVRRILLQRVERKRAVLASAPAENDGSGHN
jgi:hypothetical protein